MRTHKAILKKVKEWQGNPMMVAGVYRLFTYLPWSMIPEQYKEFFPKEAEEKWDEDIGEINLAHLKMDIESEVRAILNMMAKKNVTHCLGLVPMVLADVFIIERSVASLQGRLSKIINTYKENMDIDMELAEYLAVHDLFELLKEILNKSKINVSFNLDKAFEQVLEAIEKLKNSENQVGITKDIDKQVDEALTKYKEVQENSTE